MTNFRRQVWTKLFSSHPYPSALLHQYCRAAYDVARILGP